MHDYLNEIKSLQSKIEFALKESDFEKLAIFSTELENSVKSLSNPNRHLKITLHKKNWLDLRKLLSSVQKYQQETSAKFKDYTLKFHVTKKCTKRINNKKVNFC